jgi:hypothetical protein
MTIRHLLTLGGFLIAFASAATANATTGTISGRLLYFENQGNFCPDTTLGRPCTGARYVESTHFNQNLGVQQTKVFVRRPADNAILGQGTTNTTGNFTVTWTNPGTGVPPQLQIIWVGEEMNGRFFVRNPDGSQRVFWTWEFPVTVGGNTNMGDATWGWAGNAEPFANVYAGAHRMWFWSLFNSSRMVSTFTNLTIRPFNSATCNTSCAIADSNLVLLDDNAAFMPQARIMHEMGHIASFKAHGGGFNGTGFCEFYSFPNQNCTNFSWGFGSAEWEAAGFEEGVATHLGDTGLYAQNATQPHSCLSATFCGTNSFNIETSLGTSCGTNQNRDPLNHVRYHWDVYDTNNDYTGETLSRGISEVIDTINSFGSGFGNRQKNEPFSQFFGAKDDWDGRSLVDFKENQIARGASNSNVQWSNNCGSAGD